MGTCGEALCFHDEIIWCDDTSDAEQQMALTFAEFTLKEYLRDRDGTWIDEMPDGNKHSIGAVRYAMMEDVLRG